MSPILKRWPLTVTLVSIHAIAVVLTLAGYYMSRDPERAFIWVYAVFASYPSSLLVPAITHRDGVLLAAAFLPVGTLQWGIIGVAIDAIIHAAKREATPNI